METPKSGDQVKLGRRVLTVIWTASNHVIYVVDGGDLGHVVSVSEWRTMLEREGSPTSSQSPSPSRGPSRT